MTRNSLAVLSVTVLVLMAALAPLVLRGTAGAIASMFNAPIRWIPAEFEALKQFHRFTDEFSVHETILISWPGCTINDPRLSAFSDRVMQMKRDRQQAGEPELIVAVPNGYDLVRQLSDPATGISRASAIKRLSGVLVGVDGETSCAAVELTPDGAKYRETAMQLVMTAADQTVGLPRDKYRLAGPPIDGIAIDRLSIQSIQSFSLPSALLSLLLCWICLRSLWFTLPVVAVASLGQGFAMAAVHYSGASMNAVLIVLPPLVFVLAVSAGVHLVHYYYEELRVANVDRATASAFRKGWPPTVLAATTTAFGLGSLMVSDVGPVRQFGVLGALGVLLTCALLLLLLPGVMEWWPGRKRYVDRALQRHLQGADSHRGGIWNALAHWVHRYRLLLMGLTVVMLAGLGYGLTRVTTTLNVVSLLSDETDTVEDYHWFQEQISPLVTVEVVLHFPQTNPTDVLDRAGIVTQVHAAMLEVENVDGAISAATFLPPIPRSRGLGGVARRSAYRTRLEDRLDTLADAGYVRSTGDEQLWRISGRVQGKSDIDYGNFLRQLRGLIDPVVAEASELDGVRVSYTGVTPVVYEVQRALLQDLYKSFLTAIGLVGCVMVVALRSVVAGLVAMIPNVFPTVVLFGMMGWLEIPVDIGSVMTASVALGMAVDGTLHFLGAYRRQRRAGRDSVVATRETYIHCGRALVQTALICAAGMLTFTTSSFLPARSFAWMLLVLLLLAAIGDLIVLPALLMGPWGRWFVASPVATQVEEPDD